MVAQRPWYAKAKNLNFVARRPDAPWAQRKDEQSRVNESEAETKVGWKAREQAGICMSS